MENEEKTTSKELYETILNGRVDLKNSGKNPLARKEVRYYNPKTGKMQTQNYLEMEDIIVPVILKISDNDTVEFAMQYEYIPAINRVLLELPESPFYNIKKSEYSNDDVSECLYSKMEDLGLDMLNYKYLDSSDTAVAQSFTDQQAKFVTVSVEELYRNEKLKWFPVTSIKDYLENIDGNSSVQTKHAIQLFYSKYKDGIIKSEPTKFEYDKNIVGKETGEWQDIKNIMEHKYRFGIELSENQSAQNEADKIVDLGQFAEYGQTKDSVQCMLVRKENGRIKIGLSKQQRSPFIEREGIDEYFYECVGGLLEDGETYREAALREGKEETGIDVEKGNLIHIDEPGLISKATEEFTDFYICEISNDYKTINQNLDDQENIDEIEWFDLYKLDLQKLHAPLPAKYIIEKAKEYYSREKFKEVEDENER